MVRGLSWSLNINQMEWCHFRSGFHSLGFLQLICQKPVHRMGPNFGWSSQFRRLTSPLGTSRTEWDFYEARSKVTFTRKWSFLRWQMIQVQYLENIKLYYQVYLDIVLFEPIVRVAHFHCRNGHRLLQLLFAAYAN